MCVYDIYGYTPQCQCEIRGQPHVCVFASHQVDAKRTGLQASGVLVSASRLAVGAPGEQILMLLCTFFMWPPGFELRSSDFYGPCFYLLCHHLQSPFYHVRFLFLRRTHWNILELWQDVSQFNLRWFRKIIVCVFTFVYVCMCVERKRGGKEERRGRMRMVQEMWQNIIPYTLAIFSES